jgi:hypothetical protein
VTVRFGEAIWVEEFCGGGDRREKKQAYLKMTEQLRRRILQLRGRSS